MAPGWSSFEVTSWQGGATWVPTALQNVLRRHIFYEGRTETQELLTATAQGMMAASMQKGYTPCYGKH